MADTLFRVHFEDGTKLDVHATDTTSARKNAEAQSDGIIRKIKRIRENG
ncbi:MULTISPECIES: hypothetical protein [unclassified Rhizobium]|nr:MULTISPECIES: hypothetical protein [unclassified Rhizobium]MBB3297855.1 hypothetical protein [Rhizobium sp. BK112]MBB4177650.1 hypothetical protein [Rhizobium sp. BK109]